jgi:23S rRNA (guanosine2251-2'-O)-methyltransferase
MKAPGLDSIETNFEVRSLDANISLEEYNKLPKKPIYFILDNLRSAFNVGSIFRISDILRVKGLFLCGSTAFPPHAKLTKTSMGTIDYVPWKRFEKTIDAVQYLQQRAVPVWAAETTSRSKPFTGVDFPKEVAIVLGNEALGVNSEVLRVCDEIIEIPVYGFKNSLNVAAACAVIGYRFVERKGGRPACHP